MDDSNSPVTANPWRQLRQFTDARIALGRAGVSQPTRAHLEFQFAHAQARDAVHLPFDSQAWQQQLTDKGFEVIRLHTAAADRLTYLQRPDLGRRLDADSRRQLEDRGAREADYDVAFVIADGLSALAVHRNAVAFLEAMTSPLRDKRWRAAPIVLVEQGRVAIGDEIGALLGARMVAVLIGERPGLSSPDSLGIYFTYRPEVGRTDAERNCISNVRAQGLSLEAAAQRLLYLMREAHKRGLSGVQLKEQADQPEQTVEASATTKNFLIEYVDGN